MAKTVGFCPSCRFYKTPGRGIFPAEKFRKSFYDFPDRVAICLQPGAGGRFSVPENLPNFSSFSKEFWRNLADFHQNTLKTGEKPGKRGRGRPAAAEKDLWERRRKPLFGSGPGTLLGGPGRSLENLKNPDFWKIWPPGPQKSRF